jgi:hypothetical protein
LFGGVQVAVGVFKYSGAGRIREIEAGISISQSWHFNKTVFYWPLISREGVKRKIALRADSL